MVEEDQLMVELTVAALLNGSVVEAAGFGQRAIQRGNLSGVRVEPVSEVLLDYNPNSISSTMTICFYYITDVSQMKRGLDRGSALRLADAKFLCRLEADSPLSQNLWKPFT